MLPNEYHLFPTFLLLTLISAIPLVAVVSNPIERNISCAERFKAFGQLEISINNNHTDPPHKAHLLGQTSPLYQPIRFPIDGPWVEDTFSVSCFLQFFTSTQPGVIERP